MTGHRFLMILSGVILIAAGVFALFTPVLASLTAALIVGWMLLISAVMHLVAAFRDTEHRWWNVLFGILSALVGVSFVVNPIGGVITLTLTLGVLFAALGVAQLWLAWRRRGIDSVWMLSLSGLISIAIAALISVDLLAAASILPGIALGVEFISTGVALLLLRPVKKGTDKTAPDKTEPAAHPRST